MPHTILILPSGAIAQTQQEHVHGMSHRVMPFDMAKTMHVFEMTETGGIQRVIVKDRSDTDQVVLTQRHLREEASRFQHGDYSDPVKTSWRGYAGAERGSKWCSAYQGFIRGVT